MLTAIPDLVKKEYEGIELSVQTPAAELYTGIHHKTKATHCIKLCIDPIAAKNIEKEFDFLKKHPHPHFPQVYSWEPVHDDQGIIIREFIPGEAVGKLAGQYTEEEVFSIAAQIARGLAAIHFTGHCYGDISAGNFIWQNGKITFIDFEFIEKRHKQGDIRGTPAYMAPELFSGNPPTIQSDLYGLGVLLYFLIAGEMPFKGETYEELINAHLFLEAANPSKNRKDFSPELGLLVLRLLNKEPAERFLEANEFIREINKNFELNFEAEPEPESLSSQDKIRAVEGYSLVADTLGRLEAKENKSPAEILTLCQLYLKMVDLEKLRLHWNALPETEKPFFQAQMLMSSGKYQETLDYLNTLNNKSDEKFLIPQVTTYYHLGDHQAAISLLENAIAKARTAKDEEKMAKYLTHLGNFLWFNLETSKAIDHFEKSYLAAKKCGLVTTEALALMNLANAMLTNSQWTESLANYEKARRIYSLIGNKLETVRTILNLSGLYRFLGHVEKSRDLIGEAKEFLKKFPHPHLSIYACLLEADLEKKQKHFRQARAQFDLAESFLKKNPMPQEYCDWLTSRFEVAVEEGKLSDASQTLTQLKSAVEKAKDPLMQERIHILEALETLINPSGQFEATSFITKANKLAEKGDMEFVMDNLSRTLTLCEKRHLTAEYEAIVETQNEWLKFCETRLPNDYRERFFFFYKHKPNENAGPHTSSFLLKRIMETTRELMSELDINILVKKILHLMMDVTYTDRGFVILNEASPFIAYEHKIDKESLTSDGKPENISWTLTNQALIDRRPIITVDALTDDRFIHTHSVHQLRLRSLVILPFLCRGQVMGAVYLDSQLKSQQMKKENMAFLEALADQVGIAIHNAKAFGETKKELHQAQRDLARQERELRFKYSYKNYISCSTKILRIFELLDKITDTPVPVLIQGESGTGKEMFAKIIHYNSGRKDKRLVSINCGAIPETLLESELFGHVRGSFTGATENKVGLFEHADGGTLFLDEIGDMPMNMQVKLLRALQEKEIRPIGGVNTKKVDVRIICASNQNLKDLIDQGKFREDLYYRLNVAEIKIPPLRERREDIPMLVEHFIKKYSAENKKAEDTKMASDAMSFLLHYPWPGNVRELENIIYTLCLLCEDSKITLKTIELNREFLSATRNAKRAAHTGESGGALTEAIDNQRLTLAEAKQAFEMEQIRRVLKLYNGQVVKTAQHLRMERTQVTRLIKRYNIDRKSV